MSVYLKAIINIFLIILVSLLDLAFVSQLPFGLHRLHILIVALIFVFLLTNIRLAVWWALGGGLLLEFFTFGSFGWHIAALVASLAVIYVLFEKVITNRSLYSVSTVTAAAVFVYDMIMLWHASINGNLPAGFWISVAGIASGIGYTIVLSLIVFYLSNTSSKKLHPVFLSEKRYR